MSTRSRVAVEIPPVYRGARIDLPISTDISPDLRSWYIPKSSEWMSVYIHYDGYYEDGVGEIVERVSPADLFRSLLFGDRSSLEFDLSRDSCYILKSDPHCLPIFHDSLDEFRRASTKVDWYYWKGLDGEFGFKRNY